MDEEKNVNEDGVPVEEPQMAYQPEQSYAENPSEAPLETEATDPFAAVEPINVPDPAEYVEHSEVFETPESAELTETTEIVETPEVVENQEVAEIPETFETPQSIIVPAPETASVSMQSDRPQSFDMVQPPVAKETSETTATEQTVTPVVPVVETQIAKPAKKRGFKTVLMILLVLILMAASAAGAYFYRDSVASSAQTKNLASISDLEKTNTDLTAKLAVEVAKNATTNGQTISTTVTPSAATIANIKASITSKNTAALEGYMASSVNVANAGTEGSNPSAPAFVVASIVSFIEEATSPWDFAPSAATLSSFGNGSYKQYFPGNVVAGISANNKVIAFSFDSNAKISTVFMAADSNTLK